MVLTRRLLSTSLMASTSKNCVSSFIWTFIKTKATYHHAGLNTKDANLISKYILSLPGERLLYARRKY